MRLALAVAIAAGALTASAADARTADYSVSEAKFKADAEALNVSGYPALPAKGDIDVAVEDLAALDGKLRILGINCKFWKVDNPLSQIVARVLGGWDKDGRLEPVPAGALVRFKAKSALSTMRCVEVRELKTRCITRTAINGDAVIERPGSPPRTEPVSVETEQEQDVGVCGGLARGAAISGRSASIQLAEKLREVAAR